MMTESPMSLLDTVVSASTRTWLRVGDAYEVTRKPRDLDMTSSPEIPFAPMEAIPQGGLYEPDYIQRAPSEIRTGTYFERGDILVAKITPSFENGKQALTAALPAPFGVATTEVIPLRPRDNGQDRRFLFFYLLHPDIRQHVAGRMEGSTGRQRVPVEVLLDLPIPAFDPQEQRIIADCLEMVQRLSALRARSVRTVDELFQALLHNLMTGEIRLGDLDSSLLLPTDPN